MSAGPRQWRPSAAPAVLAERARLMGAVRGFMHEAGIMEVDTPVLVCAAPAERSLESFMVADAGFLVPSPEHGLKRLVAAGLGPIYQLGHVFRAGEVGRWHNPEFCMLEWYRPHASMSDLIDETEALIAALTGQMSGHRVAYREVFSDCVGLDPLAADAGELAAAARRLDVAPAHMQASDDRVFWLDLLMSMVVQPTLGHDRPVCVTGFPVDDAVLIETDPEMPGTGARFECFWRGVELANGAQELTDASVARARMDREIRLRESGGLPPVPVDERLLDAMSSDMPRCAGVALGIDRLLALHLDLDALADVLPFAWDRR